MDIPQFVEYRVVEECVALLNSKDTYRKMQRKLIQKLYLQSVGLPEPYISLADMSMIWRTTIPPAEYRQTQDGTPCKWSDYVHKVTSIVLARHGDSDCIICVNDSYDAAYSTKVEERDLRVQGKFLIPT